jgi:hypothetical protein
MPDSPASLIYQGQEMPDESAPDPKLFELYENGKHRRYSLLFSINGGAFAIAKFLTEDGVRTGNVLGALNLRQLSAGMALMTAVLVLDIFAFGTKMRKILPGAFDWRGKSVLILLGLLILSGWCLVGFAQQAH